MYLQKAIKLSFLESNVPKKFNYRDLEGAMKIFHGQQ